MSGLGSVLFNRGKLNSPENAQHRREIFFDLGEISQCGRIGGIVVHDQDLGFRPLCSG